MRSWHPIKPKKLDRRHLLGEHVELHVLFKVIQNDEDGWRHHPERKRWEGHLTALVRRHNMIVEEMERRGYNHKSPLPELDGRVRWPKPWQPVWKMKKILKEKQRHAEDTEERS